jgi:hypothetical protein
MQILHRLAPGLLIPVLLSTACGACALAQETGAEVVSEGGALDPGPAFVAAAKRGDGEAVRSSLAKDPELLRAVDELGYTALHWALMREHWELAVLLLEKGSDPNFVGGDGGSPLNWAVHHDHPGIVARLLDAGADPDARNQWGMTSLHTATWRGNRKVVELLLERGADPEIRTNEGWSVLHYACRSGHDALVELLIAKGARSDAKDAKGRTPEELYTPRPEPVEMSEAKLDELVGTYRLGQSWFEIEIWREGDELHLLEFGSDRLYPIGEDRLATVHAPWTLSFRRDERGRVHQVHLQFIRRGHLLTRVE